MKHTARSFALGALLVSAAWSAASPSLAQTPSTTATAAPGAPAGSTAPLKPGASSSVSAPAAPIDAVRAEALLDEGMGLLGKGSLNEACAKLEESYRLHERGDTLLNLAECHTRQGKTATAWAEFDKAIQIGLSVKFKEAIEVAKQRRDMLAEKLSSLTVAVAPEVAALEGFAIELGRVPLPRERWNAPTNRDPGPYEVKARAKGYLEFTARVELGPEKDRKTITVTLEKEPPRPVASSLPPPPPPPAPPPQRPLAVWPLVVGGAGLALLGVSAGFGADLLDAGDQLDKQCGLDRASCPSGTDLSGLRTRELTSFGVFTGAGIAGILALGAAGVGLGLDLSKRNAPASVGLVVAPGYAGVKGSFR